MSDRLDGISELFPEMVKWRRYLHERPEVSFHETETAAFIAGLLGEWGIETQRDFAGNSVIGILRGDSSGPTVALRADIDALPIQDEKSCDYVSKKPGAMHACGHDAHTASLLSLAKWFSTRKEKLKGTLLLLFQHAEEISPGGALSVVESGRLDEVDAIYGVHLWTPFPVGHVYGAAGPVMAAADEFNVAIYGKGGHGGLPHETIDSVYVAAQTIIALQSIVSRSIDPIEPGVVSVGIVRAGSSFNVIAEHCEIVGTVRTFNEEVRALAEARITQIVEHTAAMYGAQAAVNYKKGYPSVVNDVKETERFFRVAGNTFGTDHVHAMKPLMASEDFAYYLRDIPGCFLFVGAGNESKGIVYPHHHPKFDIDETAMVQSAELLASMALDRMNQS